LGETKTDSRNPAWARPCGVTVKLLVDECLISDTWASAAVQISKE
jgi:hypothetical protein